MCIIIGLMVCATGVFLVRFGLDIEFPQRPRDWPALARRAFSPREADWIAAASGSEQCERFQRIWTLREAAYKSGELAHVVGNQPIFNPLTNQVRGDFHWQYLRQGELHLSVVGRDNFSLAVHQISD